MDVLLHFGGIFLEFFKNHNFDFALKSFVLIEKASWPAYKLLLKLYDFFVLLE